jgi:microcystin degradation protein MlrC
MKKQRVAICRIMQESNGFLLEEDGLDHFEKTQGILIGDQALEALHERDDELKGFVHSIEASGIEVEIVPILNTSGFAGGLIAAEAVEYFDSVLRDQFHSTGSLDGVFMALHGAMASADNPDLDGHFLNIVRQVLGNAIPIVCSLDMHAIVTQQMLDSTSAMVAYRTHPHTDVVETAERAGRIVARILAGEISPVMACQKILLLIPPLDNGTKTGVLKEIFDRVRELSHVDSVLDCSLCSSYCWLDSAEQGWAALVTTDGNPKRGEEIAAQLAEEVWSLREQLQPEPMLEPAAAVRAAAAAEGHPIIITDSADTAGGGGPGDTTGLLKAILAERQSVDGLILLHMTDAKAIEGITASDIGSTVSLKMGNTSGKLFGGLVEVTG